LSGVHSFCTTLPPLSSNTRWKPATFSWPKAKSSAITATRLYLSSLAAYSPRGWLGCAEVQLGRTNHGLGLRWVISSAPATERIGVREERT